MATQCVMEQWSLREAANKSSLGHPDIRPVREASLPSLVNGRSGALSLGFGVWGRWGLNPGPADYESSTQARADSTI
jgi:hypothetical protein